MYRVYCDGVLIYHTTLQSMPIFNPVIDLEANKTGSFVFTLYPDHPRHEILRKLKSIITVYQGDFLLFRGRVLDEDIGFHNEKTVTCEGELAFLLDSIQRPYDFTGSVAEYLTMLIDSHNAQADAEKRFSLGVVTVTDPNDTITRSNIDYVTVWDEITDKLINNLGGYIQARHEGETVYLDYLSDFTLLSPQEITFGKNLLDLKRIRKGAEIATALIPLGAKIKDADGNDTDERLTIKTVNGGLDYITDPEAVSQYGLIVKSAIWDDVTEPGNLLTKGQAYLSDIVNPWESIELTAADLAAVDKEITSFHIGTKVRAISKPHGLNELFSVVKLSINMLNPGANRLVLGKSIQAFSAALNGLENVQAQIIGEVKETARTAADAIRNTERNMLASIEASAESVQSIVEEKYTLKEDAAALVSSVSTEVEQTQNAVTIQFTQLNKDVEAVASGADAQFEEIRKFIRFIDGKILLGEVGNELELQISTDRISFLQDGAEVAYFSNRKLYVTDAEILHSLQIGGFAFVPRANGNVSWKKVN